MGLHLGVLVRVATVSLLFVLVEPNGAIPPFGCAAAATPAAASPAATSAAATTPASTTPAASSCVTSEEGRAKQLAKRGRLAQG